jgi:hypothetical protein
MILVPIIFTEIVRGAGAKLLWNQDLESLLCASKWGIGM